MFQKILVPLDGSEMSENAMPLAMKLAENAGSSLVLHHAMRLMDLAVIESDDFRKQFPDLPTLPAEEAVCDYLMRLKKRYMRANVNIEISVTDGDPATTILDAATAEGVDLILMTTHGRSGMPRWLLGSVTERVISLAHCPVMAVRSDAPIKNVLVTLDGSILAESAVKPGISMAHFMGGDVVLMSVEEAFHLTKEEVVSVQYLQKIEPRLGDEMLEHLQSQRKQYLQRVGEGVLENAGISLTPNISTVTRTGDPASTILQYAENNGVDLIVITTHGRTGIQKWRYGSVAQKILRHAACAVMVIPASFAS